MLSNLVKQMVEFFQNATDLNNYRGIANYFVSNMGSMGSSLFLGSLDSVCASSLEHLLNLGLFPEVNQKQMY